MAKSPKVARKPARASNRQNSKGRPRRGAHKRTEMSGKSSRRVRGHGY